MTLEEVVHLPCGHAFFTRCVRDHIEIHHACPYCKQNIVDTSTTVGEQAVILALHHRLSANQGPGNLTRSVFFPALMGNAGLMYVGTAAMIAGNCIVFGLATWHLHSRQQRFYWIIQL